MSENRDQPDNAESATRELARARERVAELEADLAAARTTISVLLDKAEKRAAAPSSSAALFEEAARMEQVVQSRVREVEAKQTELANQAQDLDKMVRQRTRALAESEAQLRRKNLELERLNEMKADFISIAAHELRTPLTSIVGYLDLMMEGRFGEPPEAMERPMTSLRRNANRLKRLVDEMLDVSRIDTRRVTLHRAPCDLGDIAHQVIAQFEPITSAKHQSLSAQINDDVPVIDADGDKIHQVTEKLVANAIRYTQEGGIIVISVDVAPKEQFAGSWARLRVKDNGMGIPSHLRNRIFEPFSDVHTAKHHTSSGPDSAGLGLYIARGLIDLHGGLITVASEEGVYTEFTVLLPLIPA